MTRGFAVRVALASVFIAFVGGMPTALAGVSLIGIEIEPEYPLLEDRQALAASGIHRYTNPSSIFTPSGSALVQAMSLAPGLLTSVSLSADPKAVAVVSSLGTIEPVRDGTFAILSTGMAQGSSPAPGTDFMPSATDNTTILTLTIAPPRGSAILSFNYNFLTTEYRKFAGPGYDDRFTVTVTDTNGSREVLNISASSPSVGPVTDSNGDDSGYDLYAPSESSLLRNDGPGMPGAGMTEWTRISVPIRSSGPVTVQFKIEDIGDGLFDSAVLLDNLEIGPLVMGFPAGENWCGDHFPPTTHRLSNRGFTTTAAADGKTKVKLHFGVDLQNIYDTVDLVIPNSGPHMGGFGEIGSDDRLLSFTLPVDNVNQLLPGVDVWGATVQYFVPEEFNRGGDEDDYYRSVPMVATFYNKGGGGEPPLTWGSNFNLLRPRLVLMHGLWSEADTWITSPVLIAPLAFWELGDYQATSASAFDVNFLAPEDAMQIACLSARREDTFMSRVDYVGHSMGGLLGRIYDDHVPDRINKLITLNTPHFGSPLANTLLGIRAGLTGLRRVYFDLFMSYIQKPVHLGAIDDLAEGSAALAQMGPTEAASHAIVGTGGSQWLGSDLANSPGEYGVMFSVVSYFYDLNDFFDGDQHDLVVGAASQAGGLLASAVSTFSNIDSIHTLAPDNPASSSRIWGLLNTPADSGTFGSFPTPPIVLNPGSPTSPVPLSGGVIEDGLEIVSPLNGSPVEIGVPVVVTIEERNGFDAEKILLVTKTKVVELTSPPFVATFDFPADSLAPFTVAVMGMDVAGNLTTASAISLVPHTDAEVTDFRFFPREPTILGIGGQLQLRLLGTFDDGITRDIAHSSAGTEYYVGKDDMLTITADGLLTAVGYGDNWTIVGAYNNGIHRTANVRIYPPLELSDPIFHDGFEDSL